MARTSRSTLLLGLGLVLLPAAGLAQAGFVTFQFSFSNPGARSLGLGGAFVALADDATAAFANPAGLVQLSEREVSIEGRSWIYSTPFTEGGRIDGAPTGFGLDTNPGLRFADSSQNVTGLSFLSLVYPRERWSLAFYRHQLASFEFGGETQGLFSIPFPPDTGFRREADRRMFTEWDIVSYGLAGAWRATESLSLGLAVVYYDLGLTGREELYAFDSEERFFLPNPFRRERHFQTLTFELDDSDLRLTGGFLWRPAERWSLGGFYRPGPRGQDLRLRILSGPGDPELPPGTLLATEASPISFPDAYGLGAAFKSRGGRLTLSFEWDHVAYSVIFEDLTIDVEQEVDDADELRAGFEYAFLGRRPVVAVRAGAWLDPDHRVRDNGTGDRLNRAIFRRGDDEVHVAVGAGLAFRVFQLDFGFDHSDPVGTASLSAIYTF